LSDGSILALSAAVLAQLAALFIFHNRLRSAHLYYSGAPVAAIIVVVVLLYIAFPKSTLVWGAAFLAVRALLLSGPPKPKFTGLKWSANDRKENA
jgi:hydrogenase-4 membrane subunit HyfE